MALKFSLIFVLFLVLLVIPMLMLLVVTSISITLLRSIGKTESPPALGWLAHLGRFNKAKNLQPHKFDGMVRRWYTWEYPIRPQLQQDVPLSRFFTELQLSYARYLGYQKQPRDLNPYRFDSYITVAAPEIEVLANELVKLGRMRNFQPYHMLGHTLAFVQQCIRYAHDRSAQDKIIEYPKYPLETLLDRSGDCEDKAILAASLLARMGFTVALVVLPTHVALGIAGIEQAYGTCVTDPTTGLNYLYTETTGPGWLPGEVPLEFQADLRQGDFDILPVPTRL
jgi:hypothetical protein